MKSFKVGIVPKEYPQSTLTTGDISTIKDAVLGMIANQRNIRPRFVQNASAKSGWLVFHCADEVTAEWLKGQSYWTQIGCQALEESKFPRDHVVVGYFKHAPELQMKPF